MIKGWRNDPRWVEIYERRDNARIAREIERIKASIALAQSKAQHEYAMRQIRSGRPAWDIGYA